MSFPPTPSHFLLASRSPDACPETSRAEHQKEKCPFLFTCLPKPRRRRGKNWSRANPKSKEHFSLVSAEALRGGDGAIVRAYNLDQSHHALRASHLLALKKPLSSVLVGGSGIEPLASSMSTMRSAPELTALDFLEPRGIAPLSEIISQESLQV